MPKAKNPITEAERSRRFIEKAHELGVATRDAVERTERFLKKVLKPKEPPKKVD
jgi:hypothetical protein